MKRLPLPYATDDEYREPTPLAKAIMMPLHDPNWQSRVLNGYASTSLQKVQRTTTEAKP